MLILLTIVHVIVCIFLVGVVLLQSGKAADLAGAFGGMGSQTAFGPRGSATLLSKLTTIAAGLFMVTSLSLSIISTRTGTTSPTIFDKKKPAAAQKQQQQQQVVPQIPGGENKGISVTTTGPDGKQRQSTIPVDTSKLPTTPPTGATPVTPTPEKKQ